MHQQPCVDKNMKDHLYYLDQWKVRQPQLVKAGVWKLKGEWHNLGFKVKEGAKGWHYTYYCPATQCEQSGWKYSPADVDPRRTRKGSRYRHMQHVILYGI